MQGSALGSTAYVSNASDLHPINPTIHLFKHADDTYLLNSSICQLPSIQYELLPVARANGSIRNNLKLNTNKSIEMIVHSKHRKLTNSPPCIPDVSSWKYEHSAWSTVQPWSHVQAVVGTAARSMYALKTIKKHGLEGHAMGRYTRATLLLRAYPLVQQYTWWLRELLLIQIKY